MTNGVDMSWASNPDWFHFEGLVPVIHDDAPKEAKDSYERYVKQPYGKEKNKNRHVV
ncbi:MAG: hypothetical protein HUJ72_02445 [Blautia sp.]|nr:hypothetical protein [Blautia sp.]